jgi:hypothetical protein
MSEVTRRRALVAGGAALLAGCLSNGDDDSADSDDTPTPDESDNSDESETPENPETKTPDESEESDDTSQALPSALSTILGTIPETVDDYEAMSVWIVTPTPDNDRSPATGLLGDIESQLGVSPESVDRIGTALFGDFQQTIGVAVGSFSADEVTDSGQRSMHVEDGFAVVAQQEGDGWEDGLKGALAAREDTESGLLAGAASQVLAPIAEDERVILQTNTGAQQNNGAIDESVEMFGYGASLVGNLREEIVVTALFEDSSAATEDAVTKVAAANGFRPDDMEVSTTENRGVGSFVRDIPENRLPDNSPDAQFVLAVTESRAVLKHAGSEDVRPGRIELHVDGEPVEAPWDGRETPIEPDEEFEIDVAPFSLVEVVWDDPNNEGVTQTLGQSVVAAQDTFSATYDTDAKAVTVTYDGNPTVDANRLKLRRNRTQETEQGETLLTEYVGDTLEQGDSFTVSDVGYGESLSVSLTVDSNGPLLAQTVFNFFAQPPGTFGFDYDGESLTITYDDEPAPADQYRVKINRDATSVQFSDVYSQLAAGDAIEVDAEIGDDIQIEWTGEDETIVVAYHTVLPDTEFDIEYDEDAGELRLTHAGGASVESEKLAVLLRTDERAQRAWPGEGTVTEGETVTLDLESDQTVTAVSVIYNGTGTLASKQFDE